METKFNYNSEKKLKRFSLTALFFTSIGVSIYGIWIYAIENRASHLESVEYFHSFFPSFLRARFSTTYLSILILLAALFFAAKAINISGKFWKLFNFVVMVLSGLLLALNIFSLL